MSDTASPVEIRDLREQKWAWTEKSLIFSEHISNAAFRLYMAIATYANNESQQARPSLETLADRLPFSRATVFRAKRELESLQLIQVEERPGKPHLYTLLKVPDEIKEPKQKPASNANLFNDLIAFYIKNAKRYRNIDLQISAADKSMLGRTINKLTVPQHVYEQLMVYFLANRRYRSLSPSLKVFLSSAVINGLMNDIKNRPEFWKELDAHMQGMRDVEVEEFTPAQPRETAHGIKSIADVLGIRFQHIKKPANQTTT